MTFALYINSDPNGKQLEDVKITKIYKEATTYRGNDTEDNGPAFSEEGVKKLEDIVL